MNARRRWWRVLSAALVCGGLLASRVPAGAVADDEAAPVASRPLKAGIIPLRDVWYVGEPITLRVVFTNLDMETTLINTSPSALAHMVFAVTYHGATYRFTASQRASSEVKYLMLGSSEETQVECLLVQEPIPFGASFDRQFYGTLPSAATDMEVRAIYTNTDTGTRNVTPFWTGTVTSDPVTVRMAVR